jgi:parallel beta-helix repeat protein
MTRPILAALAAVAVSAATPMETRAAVTCSDRTAAAITSVAAESRACQEAIAKESAKFLKTKMKTLAKCRTKQDAGACPTTGDTDKIHEAAVKATEGIAAACGDDAAQAGLTSSYAGGTTDAAISSCTLSQHSVVGELVVANATGATTEAWPETGKERAGCVKQLAKSAWQFVDKGLKNANSCLKKQMKDGVAGDLAPICVGGFSGGSFVAPTDPKTALKQAKVFEKTDDKIAKKCTDAGTLDQIQTIFGCAGATTVADLQACIACQGWDAILEALEQEYSETGEFVAHGAGAFQAAVTAASSGDKLLIASGDYVEEVVVSKADLSLVGCGAATDERPRVVAPAVEVSGRGIDSNGFDDLLFQSIAVFGQDNDGIRVTNADNITFRDIVADGNLESAYAVFPRTCNNVLIELCKTTRVNDAPLYVGQSSTIVVRHNDVRESVAGIEIENCGNAQVYGNYATENTAGLLVFKDGSLPVQLSQCHAVHHNLFESNNTPNFGSGTVAGVPAGSGILVISNDTTPFHHNISRNNRTFGFALVDQDAAAFGPPFSADQLPEYNYVFDNIFTGNGFDPDFDFGTDAFAFMMSYPGVGNCQSGNTLGAEILFSALPVCTLPPPSFASCPAPSVP